MNILYLIDPLASLKPPTDTSLLLIREATRRRHRNFTAEHRDLQVVKGVPRAIATPTGLDKKGFGMTLGKTRVMELDDFDAIVFRHDPPFDVDYLHATQIVDLSRVRAVLNSARGLRAANEKLYALNFPDAMPPTIMTRDRGEAMKFLAEMKEVVAKPLDSFGGVGVVLLCKGDIGVPSVVDILTGEGARQALFQKFVKGIDKRVFVINNRVEGVMIRKGGSHDFRQNMHVGGQPTLSELSPIEKKRVEMILPRLKEDGLNFVGLDLIGGYLSEINVTSPTGFWHYESVSRRMLTKEVLDMLEEMASY
jgi:glutathione synthase